MQSKTLVLLALSASAAVASPFHKRQELHHHRFHGTGSGAIVPTGSGRPIPVVNDTNGFFTPSGEASIMPITMTVSPLPQESGSGLATFGNAASDDASSSCTSTSIATETSINLVTVTAAARDLENTKSVSAGAFYGGSRTWSGSWSQSSAPAASNSAAISSVPSVGNPSTTFASMPSASKSGIASGSASVSASVVASASASGSAPASKSASASASASATGAPTTGSSGGKRGISYNDASLVAAFGNSVSWAYNWGSTAGGSLSVDYVPMMWGKDQVSGFASKVGSATHVLSFNEPDLGAQANIDPQTAAQLHKEGMADLIGKVQIGSPAVTNGASTSPPMGTIWLDQFLTACGADCGITFVAYHWYATADSIDYFKQHTQDVIDVANKHGINKVWLTEFEPSGSTDAQAAFMKEAVSFLDSTAAVERYAAFMASDGTMLSGTSLNSVGSAYAGAS